MDNSTSMADVCPALPTHRPAPRGVPVGTCFVTEKSSFLATTSPSFIRAAVNTPAAPVSVGRVDEGLVYTCISPRIDCAQRWAKRLRLTPNMKLTLLSRVVAQMGPVTGPSPRGRAMSGRITDKVPMHLNFPLRALAHAATVNVGEIKSIRTEFDKSICAAPMML